MSAIASTAKSCQTEIVAQLNDVIDQKGVKEQVLKNAQEMATVACQHILDPLKEDLKKFDGVPEDKELMLELVYDFLKQAGFNFSANCLKYESQHPEAFEDFDRRKFGKDNGCCTYDKTPYLVQIIREMQRNQ